MLPDLKSLLYKLYRLFPVGKAPQEEVDEVLADNERMYLEKYGFLTKEKYGKDTFYNLGPNALTLISTWEMERMTKVMTGLAAFALLFSAISIVISFGISKFWSSVVGGIIAIWIIWTLLRANKPY